MGETVRGVFLIESEPGSGEYHQILLTKSQFKLVSKAIWGVFPTSGERVALRISDETYELPDDIQSTYTPVEIHERM